MIADKLIQNYKLEPNNYDVYETACLSQDFLNRWDSRCDERFWNFDLGSVPKVWIAVINELLCWLEVNCPDFRILQIKTKFGGARIYLEGISAEVMREVSRLEAVLYDERMIY